MSFRFSLETVLRLRRSLEQREQRLLLAMQVHVEQTKDRIAQIGTELNGRDRACQDELSQGTAAVRLHFELACRDVLFAQRKSLQVELHRLEELRDRQRAVYYQSRQRREMLERLREQAWQVFRETEERLKQRRLDDLHLLLRQHRRRG